MEPESSRQLNFIVAEARKLTGEALGRYLDEVCEGAVGLRAEVERALDNTLDDRTVSMENDADAVANGGVLANRFEVVQFVGRGGMGEVYTAKDLDLGGVVALKTVRPAHANDEVAMNRFRREIQLARQVTHPNICRVFDVGRHAPQTGPPILFLTMEYLEGETLRDRLKRQGAIPLAELVTFAEQLADGLEALHEKGIVHRDLKPANVMLTSGNPVRAVIMDFGLARLIDAESSVNPITHSGFVVGTPGYMSPEQMRGEPATTLTDIYSLGVMLYEMVTGKRLPTGNPAAILHNSRLPANCEACIRHCLESDPRARPQTAGEAVAPLLAGRGPGAIVAPMANLAPGAQVGEYRVIRLIGSGSRGEVYLAEDLKLGREVALGVVAQGPLPDPVSRQRFERDAKAVSKLNHRNAAAVYEFGEWSGGLYLAMEHVPGETLQTRLDRGPLGWDEVASVGVQLAEVLHAAHEKDLSHRSLNPGKIMLGPEGVVKVLDFRIAGEAAEGGAVAYMSPEQALGKPVDVRADIFSLGVVLYEMATARRPFAGTTTTEILSKILSSPPEPLARWNYSTPAEMERIVRKCLEKMPEDRYQSAREVGIDLRSWLRGGAAGAASGVSSYVAPPTAAVAPAVAKKPAPTRRWALVAGGAAAATVAGYGILSVLEQVPPESLVILPFTNQGTADDEVLSDGLTESLIDQIARTGALRVIARSAVFRFKKIDDPMEAARKLKAAILVYGRFIPDKDQYNVSLEIVDVQTSALRGQYSAVMTGAGLQTTASDLVDHILKALGIRKRKPAGPTRAVDPEAYQYYLRGRHTLDRRLPDAFTKAAELFRKAIEVDPMFAPAFAGLADVYTFESGILPPNDACPKARAAARKAIDLDPSLAEAHASLGWVKVRYEWAWQEAEAAFQKAIGLNPSFPSSHSYYARLMTARKRFGEAEAEQKKAIALDPLSQPLTAALGMTYYYGRRFDEAERLFRNVILEQPDSSIEAMSYLGLVHIAKKNYAAAVEVLEQSIKLMGDDDYGIVSDLGMAYALMGNHVKALDALGRVERIIARGEYVIPSSLAGLRLALGQKDLALDALEKSVEPDHSWPVMYYAVEPKLDPVRGEPRFVSLLKRTGAVTG